MADTPPKRLSTLDRLKAKASQGQGVALDETRKLLAVVTKPGNTPTGQPAGTGDQDRQPGQSKGTTSRDSPQGQSERTVHMDSPPGQPDRTARKDSPIGLPTGTVQADSPGGQPDRTARKDSLSGQPVPGDSPSGQPAGTPGLSSGTPEEDTPEGQAKGTAWQDMGAPANLLVKPAAVRSDGQRALFDYLKNNPNILTSNNLLADTLGLAYGTVRKGLRKFRAMGLIQVRNHRARGGEQGLHIIFVGGGQADGTPDQDTPKGQSHRTVPTHSKKIDREENLSISPEERLRRLTADDVEFFWPNLARAGFGPSQVEQILDCLAKVGKPADKITLGLDYIEWELEHGRCKDSKGEQVKNPCDWAFRCLGRSGYYRRPEGYVSPQEQAELDAAKEAEAIVEAQKRKEEAEFQAWRVSLSDEDLTRLKTSDKALRLAMTEQTLRIYWRREVAGKGA